MTKLNRVLLMSAFVAITIGSGVLHGHLHQRWGAPQRMAKAAEQLQDFPQQFGDWKRVSEAELGESAVEILQCAGYINHTYTNQETGQTIAVALIVGPGSTMSVHTPEICFSSNNFKIDQTRQEFKINVDDTDHSLWQLAFKSNAEHYRLQVQYAWSTGTEWQAPAQPRFAFAGQPVLYKIQITERLPDAKEASDFEPFLRDLIPVLNERLVASSSAS